MKYRIYLLLVAVVIAIGAVLYLPSLAQKQKTAVLPAETTNQQQQNPDYYSYQGKDGVDALSLLKQKASVEESQPGFVTSINGRKTDQKKKEFWSFYVNGKMAEVGSADYVTKSTDKIEWKIENY